MDTDVIMDMITGREPWVDTSSAVLDWAKRNPMSASVAWHSLANLFYLTTASKVFLVDLSRFLHIPPVGNADFQQAMKLDLTDSEDAMQVACALRHQAKVLITRNQRHYRKSPIPAITPTDFLKQLTEK